MKRLVHTNGLNDAVDLLDGAGNMVRYIEPCDSFTDPTILVYFDLSTGEVFIELYEICADTHYLRTNTPYCIERYHLPEAQIGWLEEDGGDVLYATRSLAKIAALRGEEDFF